MHTLRHYHLSVESARVLLLAAFAVGFASCARNNDSREAGWRIVRGTGFRLTAPDTLKLREAHAADFQLYSLTARSGRVLLRIYSGNFPSPLRLSSTIIPALQSKPLMTDTTIRWRSGTGVLGRETLFRIGKGTEYPEFLDVWYDSLSHVLAAEGDSIIQTIRPESTGMPH